MRATLWLFNIHFWKSIYGPVMAFIFPPLLLVILGNIMTLEYVLPGVLSMSGMFIGVLSMPLFVMEMKGSTLLKYVGSSPLNSRRFTVAVVLFYLLISIMAVVNTLLFGMFFFWKDVFPATGFTTGLYSGIFSPFGSFSFWIANIIHISMSLGIGLIIVTFSKTVQRALAAGLMISIPSMFISGMVIPVDIIANSTAMQWISRLTPFRYSTGLLVVSSTPLPQMGDFLQHVSPASLGLIFNTVNPDGSIVIAGWNEPVKSIHDLTNAMNQIVARDGLDKFIEDNVFDKVLFNEIFIKNDISTMTSASNNIFAIGREWGVRKTPDIAEIQSFINEFLYGVASSDAMYNDGGLYTLLRMQEFIDRKDMSWMELFMEQNITLYSRLDMIMNLLLPIGITSFSVYLAINRFKWSGR